MYTLNNRKFNRLSSIAAAIVFLIIAVILVGMDRSNLLDNDNYIESFRGNRFLVIWDLFIDKKTIESLGVVYFSEEFVWLAFTKLFSEIFSPEASVYVLALVVNFFVFLGCLKTDKPIVAIILWLIIPVGFIVIGLYQLRQGLAYSLFFFGTYYLKPGRFGLLSCGIHTTLLVPYIFYLVDLFFRRAKSWIVPAASAAALSWVLATIGGYLFENFGGRRLESYSIDDGADSINYVISALLFAAFYLTNYAHHHRQKNVAARIFSLTGFGVSIFIIISFYIFPIGTSRVGYFLMLFALPLLSESGALNLTKFKEPRVAFGALIILFIAYQAIKFIVVD
jgi:hypothetical protein